MNNIPQMVSKFKENLRKAGIQDPELSRMVRNYENDLREVRESVRRSHEDAKRMAEIEKRRIENMMM